MLPPARAEAAIYHTGTDGMTDTIRGIGYLDGTLYLFANGGAHYTWTPEGGAPAALAALGISAPETWAEFFELLGRLPELLSGTGATARRGFHANLCPAGIGRKRGCLRSVDEDAQARRLVAVSTRIHARRGSDESADA